MTTINAGILESPAKIDLTQSFTVEDVRKMIGSVKDDRTWQLVITYAGTAYICDREVVPNRQPPKIRDYPLGVELGDPRLYEDRKKMAERDKELLDQGSDLIYMQFESYGQGNGYVGSDAAMDDNWVKRVYKDLLENWPTPRHGSTYIGN